MDEFEFGVVGDRACVRGFNGGSIMVWGGITLNHRTYLVILPAPGMTAVRYVEEILQPHVLPMSRRIGRNFILMQDNARRHNLQIYGGKLN